MKYIIIGLGNYGEVLAKELAAMGHEVVGVDLNEGHMDALKDKMATSFVLDATDQQALEVLPLQEVDVVIVAIGKNFGASVRVVALLKQKQVRHIYARAIDAVHQSILEAFSIDKVLTPEKDAARDFVQLLTLNSHAEAFRLDDEYYVMKFKVPAQCVGYSVAKLSLQEDFQLTLLAVKKAEESKNMFGLKVVRRQVDKAIESDYLLLPEDELVCWGRYRDFQAFWKAL